VKILFVRTIKKFCSYTPANCIQIALVVDCSVYFSALQQTSAFVKQKITRNYFLILIFLDDKEFVATISYVYSNKLPETTRERTRKIVKCIQEKMKELDYTFYDSYKYFDQGCKMYSYLDQMLHLLSEKGRFYKKLFPFRSP